ncbi:MAG: hypothetical protein LIP00_09440 [Parabacteroides sp.]|nr:hypothetical protein [Parabacteroides sp.]
MKNILFFLLPVFLLSCSRKQADAVVSFDTDTLINDSYIGNGAQWDPYQLDYGKGRLAISDADWKKLYDRLDFMRPQFIRMMINTSSFVDNGKLTPEKGMETLSKMLDYCQSRHVTVMFGDWGWSVLNTREGTINEKNMQHAAGLMNYLVNEKGYTCIGYYNLINEPNGDWSATDTNYRLWVSSMKQFYRNMEEWKMNGKVSLAGPDIAIWGKDETWWIDSTAVQLGDKVGLYDIHTYPSKITVNSGEYSAILSAYKNAVPNGKKIVMGEIGLKFVEEADSLYDQENTRRAKAKKHASLNDSQMFVYDYRYGIDMADALLQAINTGYSGSVAWMLDDAMHSNEAPDKLKIWGFWNILGEEQFGAEEERVRPWYYAWSLLTRYIPVGSRIYKSDVSGDTGIKAVISKKDGNCTIGLLNISKSDKTVDLTGPGLPERAGYKKFIYSDGTLETAGDCMLLPNEENLTLDFSKGKSVCIPAESLVVYTTFDY